jgi:hypothetical protein
MPANVDSMAYYGDPPWHGLGVSVPARATATEMINAAGLDWQVRMTPIPNVGVGAKAKARRCHLTRMPRNTSEQEVPLGVVSTRYRPLQNSEAFDFFDPIIGDKKAVFETAVRWVTENGCGSLQKLQGKSGWRATTAVQSISCCRTLMTVAARLE